MAELNLDEIRGKWLVVCGYCDAGLPMSCTHPEGDYRPVMLRLVEEVVRLCALDCPRCAKLRDEVAFWKDQQKLAASVAATIADLDEEAPALRQLLRREIARRQRAEDERDRLAYRLSQIVVPSRTEPTRED